MWPAASCPCCHGSGISNSTSVNLSFLGWFPRVLSPSSEKITDTLCSMMWLPHAIITLSHLRTNRKNICVHSMQIVFSPRYFRALVGWPVDGKDHLSFTGSPASQGPRAGVSHSRALLLYMGNLVSQADYKTFDPFVPPREPNLPNKLNNWGFCIFDSHQTPTVDLQCWAASSQVVLSLTSYPGSLELLTLGISSRQTLKGLFWKVP